MSNQGSEQRFIGVAEACRRLCCGRTTIYTHYLAQGKLSPIKRGRKTLFLAGAIDRIIQDEAHKPLTLTHQEP